MQIEREVFRQVLVGKNLAQQPLVAFAEDDVVMRQLALAGITALGAEVDHKEGHAVLLALDPKVIVDASLRLGDHIEIGVGHVSIGNHNVGGNQRAIAQPHAGGAPVLNFDLFHLGIGADLDAHFVEQPPKALHNRPGSAHGIVNAPFAFQVVNQHIK